MDRYQQTFSRLQLSSDKKRAHIGFCPFAVLGDPNAKECLKRIAIYLDSNPDFLELGIPFSDPIADGPVVQAADVRAITSGTTPKSAIELVKKIREMCTRHSRTSKANSDTLSGIPIGILTYANIVLHYGIDAFYRDLKNAGADSILVADVPLEEIAPFAKAAKKYKLHQIFLVSELTDTARLKKIEKFATRFLYVVSALTVTGARTTVTPSTISLIHRLKKLTKLPLVIGFGISTKEHIQELQKAGADGAIVGSALVKTPTKELAHLFKKLR